MVESTEEITPGGTKKTAKLTSYKPSDSDNRLIEYFVVVSSVERQAEDVAKSKRENPNDMSFSDWKTESHDDEEENEFAGKHFRPTVTARYPLYDHPDNPLHENVTFFCHPSGGIQLRTDPIMPKVHYFVATGGSGKQVYGTCLTLWEPYMLKIKSKSPADDKEKNSKESATKKEVFLPKCLVLLSHWPYLAAFREYLTQLHRLSKMGEMNLPIERYIANFCSEIPAPPPGSFEVQTTMLDSVIRIWSLPHNLPIAWVSLPFGVLFECLDVENIILVWHCLVLERQVLLTSTQLSVLTTASEILLSLLFPMTWSHAYIPVLPHFLIPILSAPMPFLCGINKANLADALYDLGRECVLVDLDKNTVTLGPDTTPLPPIPPVQEAALRNHLEENVGMVFREARSLTRNDDYSDSGAHLPNHVKVMAEAMWESKLCLYDEAFHLFFTPESKNILNGNDSSGMDVSDQDVNNPISMMTKASDKQAVRKQSAWDAVQESFLDTFVYLLRNYRKFLVFPSKHNEGSYGGAGFRSKEFIESQRYDMREFLTQMIGTQMFDNFITKRLYGSGEADVAFFDMAVDRFLKSAGLFSDVALSGRLMDAAGGFKSTDKRASSTKTAQKKAARPAMTRKDEDPLLQSARVHRKLKTIVPPEPTGEGLPPHPMIVESADHVVSMPDNDDSSSTSGTRRSHPSIPGSPTRSYKSAQEKAAEIIERQKMMRYTYATFPSELNSELFGTPRPLPAAVIAEFDRQRKDAARFRRKTLKNQPSDKKNHIQRAHSTVDPVTPPSPEVATFTVFFMAFSALVGKDLMDIAKDQSAQERTILSTYVPTTVTETDDTDVDSELGESEAGRISEADNAAEGMHVGDEDAAVVDEQEKEHVAAMKAVRPDMGAMFGDDDDSTAGKANGTAEAEESVKSDVDKSVTTNGDSRSNIGGSDKEDQSGFLTPEEVDSGYNTPTEDDDRTEAKTERSEVTAKSEDSRPRQRFRDKLSDLQIEEAKALGRAQLGLAFEMLTMMKKRGLKADPEAYQALIDACGRVGDTKRATELLAKMHEDGIVADGTVYACLVSAFSAETKWKDGAKEEELPEWANSTAVEMDWNKLQKRSLLDRIVGKVVDLDEDDEEDSEEVGTYQKLRNRLRRGGIKQDKPDKASQSKVEFFVTELVEGQIALGENLLEIVFPDISVDTENEVCPRCNFLLSDDEVVAGWKPGDSNDYTTACSNCTQRFVPHFCVQCSAPTFVGSRGPASPLMCERLSPWVLQKEIRSVMSDREGIENLLDPKWRQREYKNAVLWWNLVLSCMRYRFPFSFLLQGSFEQNLIAPLPEE